ncbi:MAG: NPCBM/NEW2 domain-containing protein, partial [Verrucomicrobia bacterium]|nr:NPCBM/NEW2 domain-containing protein [Verrucomicrobiota bacterium]
QLFLKVAEQWEDFRIPAKIGSSKKRVSLSSTRWDNATVGWFVPSFNGVLDPDGKWFRPLETTQGRCPHGLYAHAPSSYTYSLGGKWQRLETRMGIQRGRREGSVIFVIKGDGKELFRSALVRLADGEVTVDLDVSGVQTLELVTETGNDGGNGDWGLWIAPSLVR